MCSFLAATSVKMICSGLTPCAMATAKKQKGHPVEYLTTIYDTQQITRSMTIKIVIKPQHLWDTLKQNQGNTNARHTEHVYQLNREWTTIKGQHKCKKARMKAVRRACTRTYRPSDEFPLQLGNARAIRHYWGHVSISCTYITQTCIRSVQTYFMCFMSSTYTSAIIIWWSEYSFNSFISHLQGVLQLQSLQSIHPKQSERSTKTGLTYPKGSDVFSIFS